VVNPTEEGVFVKKGDLLIKLNDSVILAEVARAQKQANLMTEIEFAQVALETALVAQKVKQAANDKRPGTYTASEMRQFDLEVRKGEAQLAKSKEDKILHELDLKIKEAQLNQYTVLSPFDGFITKVQKYPGQNVRPGDPVLTLTDISELRASLKVHFKHRDKLFVGDEVEITVDTQGGAAPRQATNAEPASELGKFFGNDEKGGPRAEPDPSAVNAQDEQKPFIGKIMFIDPKVEPDSTQTLMIKLSVAVPNRKDRFGRFMLQEGMPVKAVVLAKPRTE
jgi:multidrug efflux pump subunit AcrA (membrane-fusion protein)